jgi:hypothetical protein
MEAMISEQKRTSWMFMMYFKKGGEFGFNRSLAKHYRVIILGCITHNQNKSALQTIKTSNPNLHLVIIAHP